MRVARDQVREPGVEQRLRAGSVPPAEPPVDRRSRELYDDAGVDELAQAFRPLLYVRIPLGMREHDAEAAHAQAEHEIRQPDRPADVRELEQQQVRIAAESEAAQRCVVERLGVREVELSAGKQLDGDAARARGLAHPSDGELHLLRGRRVVVTDVRRRRDPRDAVLLRGAEDVEAAVDRRRPVVDPGQDVRVEIDHGAAVTPL